MDRHFILTHGRSGSNFLANSINKHPALVNYGEVLGEWTIPYQLFRVYEKSGKGWCDFLDTLYSNDFCYFAAQTLSLFSHLKKRTKPNYKFKSEVKSLGLKDFVFLIDKRGLAEYLIENEDIKIIYLTRRNQLSRYLSLLNMSQSGVVKAEKQDLPHNKFRIDIEDLLLSIRTYEEEEDCGDQLVSLISQSRIMAIDYDDYFVDFESIRTTHAKLFEFLDVDYVESISLQKKILAKDPYEHITNYDEVIDALKSHRSL